MISRRRLILSAPAICLARPAQAFGLGAVGGGGGDPYSIYDAPNLDAPYTDITGRVEVSAALVGGESTAISLEIGQSLAANYGVSLYTPASAKAQNIDIYNQKVYQTKDPVLGASSNSGSPIGRYQDKLISAGVWQRHIAATVAVGGTSISDWARGQCNGRLLVALKVIRGLGLTLTYCYWQQGQQDAIRGTSSASYQADFAIITATVRAVFPGCPLFIAQDTMDANVTNATIRAAQAACVVPADGRYSGGDVDSLTGGTNRQADGTHLTDVGNDNLATIKKNAVHAVF